MSTEKQINANRQNAKKSTGPTSAEGKQKSSRNSFKHGQFANAVVLENESQERFQMMVATLRAELRPRTAYEEDLVARMAAARWRQMRLWTVESAALSAEIRKQQDMAISETAHPAVRAAVALQAQHENAGWVALLRNQDAAYDRQYYRAFQLYLKLRKKETLEDEMLGEEILFEDQIQENEPNSEPQP